MKYSSAFLRKDAKGRFRGALSYKDGDKWRTVTKQLASTGKRAAEKELDEWRAQMELKAETEYGPAEKAGGVTVAEYVAQYIEAKALNVEASTVTGYRSLLNNAIAPYIGDVPLAELDAQAVEDWVTALCGKRSKTTAKKALVLLRAALAKADKRNLIPVNPTDTVEKPKTKGERKRPNALDEHERGRVAAFVAIDPADPFSMAVRLALFCGMRRGEICALRWDSVNVRRCTLEVRESLGIADAGDIGADYGERVWADVYVKGTKNEGSERTVNFSKSVADALKARRDRMTDECARAGVPFKDSLFVTGTIDGKPMNPHTLSHRWSSLVTAMGLVGTEGRPPVFHDLRHAYATAAIANGIDVKVVSRQMGHKDATMTLNTYTSVDPDAARRGADRLDEALTKDAAMASEGAEVIAFRPTGTEA